LIELLIVVAILGMLGTLTVAGTGQARLQARDTRRKADMKTLRDALNLYLSKTGLFPSGHPDPGICITGSDAFSAQLISAGVMKAVPYDPLPAWAADPAYCFTYTSDDGSYYVLRYVLEAPQGGGGCGGNPQEQFIVEGA
jgi:type II secretory pathway pseudopilin PulG